jgi:hypothetical protein
MSRRLVAVCALAVSLAAFVARADDKPLDPKAIDAAIEKGAAYLLENHGRAPKFPAYEGDELVLYALLHAGKTAKDPRLAELTERILKRPLEKSPYPVYNVSLRTMALAKLDAPRFQHEIAQCAWWLVNAQTDNGQWDYYGPKKPVPSEFARVKWTAKLPPGDAGPKEAKTATKRTGLEVRRDEPWTAIPSNAPVQKMYRNTSTAQYAVLGLYAAHRSLVQVPQETWKRAQDAVLADGRGGWGYVLPDDKKNDWQPSSHLLPGMTASNLAVLAIVKDVLEKPDPGIDKAVEKGFDYLGANARTLLKAPPVPAGASPDALALVYHYYGLFSLERAAILWKRETVGDLEWYPTGARFLLENQQKDGSWGADYPGGASDRLVDTAFAVLFLKRAVPPRIATGSGH